MFISATFRALVFLIFFGCCCNAFEHRFILWGRRRSLHLPCRSSASNDPESFEQELKRIFELTTLSDDKSVAKSEPTMSRQERNQRVRENLAELQRISASMNLQPMGQINKKPVAKDLDQGLDDDEEYARSLEDQKLYDTYENRYESVLGDAMEFMQLTETEEMLRNDVSNNEYEFEFDPDKLSPEDMTLMQSSTTKVKNNFAARSREIARQSLLAKLSSAPPSHQGPFCSTCKRPSSQEELADFSGKCSLCRQEELRSVPSTVFSGVPNRDRASDRGAIEYSSTSHLAGRADAPNPLMTTPPTASSAVTTSTRVFPPIPTAPPSSSSSTSSDSVAYKRAIPTTPTDQRRKQYPVPVTKSVPMPMQVPAPVIMDGTDEYFDDDETDEIGILFTRVEELTNRTNQIGLDVAWDSAEIRRTINDLVQELRKMKLEMEELKLLVAGKSNNSSRRKTRE